MALVDTFVTKLDGEFTADDLLRTAVRQLLT